MKRRYHCTRLLCLLLFISPKWNPIHFNNFEPKSLLIAVQTSHHKLFYAIISAVYTGIKKPESFSHSGFSLKVARQLPLNTPKNPNRKTHLRSVIFWNSAEISLVFCQCKRSLQSRRYYLGFWSRGTWPSAESPDRGPLVMRTTRVRSKVERSRACAPLTKTQVWDSGFFAHALFVPKTPNIMGFSGSVNGTTKNPGFLDFGFCQCKWA